MKPILKSIFGASLTVVALTGALPVRARAQLVDSKKTLTLEGAEKVIAAAKAEAKKNHEGGVIAVVDDGGNLIALERIDGTFAAGANISMGKARTAVLFKKPSKFFEDVVNKGRTAMVALNDFTPLQGGIPILVEGQVVGGAGVSGAASAAQDEAVAMAGAAARHWGWSWRLRVQSWSWSRTTNLWRERKRLEFKVLLKLGFSFISSTAIRAT